MSITVTILETGTIRIRPSHQAGNMSLPVWRRRLAILLDRQWTQPLPIYTYLVEHDEASSCSTAERAPAAPPRAGSPGGTRQGDADHPSGQRGQPGLERRGRGHRLDPRRHQLQCRWPGLAHHRPARNAADNNKAFQAFRPGQIKTWTTGVAKSLTS